MKETLRRWGRALLDPFGVQLYFILCSFMVEIPLTMSYMWWWKKVGLVWAAAVIVYDLLTRRRCLKAPFALPAMGLLCAYALTLVVVWRQYPAAFQETYLDWFCSIVVLLVLFPPTTDDREQGRWRLQCINWLIIGLTTAAALISIWMFAVQMGGYFYSSITDYAYPVGFVNSRLTGVYRNAIYPTALTGAMAAALQWVMQRGRAPVRRTLLAVAMAANVLYIALSNSRGVSIALALFCGLIALFLVRRHSLRRGEAAGRPSRRTGVRAWLTGAVCAAAAVAVAVAAVPLIRSACAGLPAQVRQAFGTVSSPFSATPGGEVEPDVLPEEEEPLPQEPSVQEPVDWSRIQDDNHGTLTGRPVIWRQGLRYFAERPLLGYGPYTLKDEIRLSEDSTERLSHFHNILLQSLVSVGVVGSLFFFVLLGGCTLRVLRRLLHRPEETYALEAVLGALLAAILLVNMADTTLFFLSKNSEFVFWSYLGYALLLADAPPLAMDRPVRWLDARLPRLSEW